MNRISAISAICTVIFLLLFWAFLHFGGLNLKEVEKPKIESSKSNSSFAKDKQSTSLVSRTSTKQAYDSVAFASIKFGTSKKEFEKEIRSFYKKTRNGYWYSLSEYDFDRIVGKYHNGKLYSIEFVGNSLNYENFDILAPPSFHTLLGLITEKYGAPSSFSGLKKWHLYENNRTDIAASWYVRDKIIYIMIKADDGDYHINLEIYQHSVSDKVYQEKLKKDKNASIRAKEVFGGK